MVDFLEQFLNVKPQTRAQSAVDSISGEYDSLQKTKAIAQNRQRVADMLSQQQGLSGVLQNAGGGLEEMASNPMQDQGSRFLASFLSSYGKAKDGQTEKVFNDAVAQGDYETAGKIASPDQREELRKIIMGERETEFANKKLGLAERELGINEKISNQRMGIEQQKLGLDKQRMGLSAKKFDFEVQKLQKEIESGGRDPEALFDDTQKLRKEFLDSAKVYETQRDAYGRINASAEDPSPAGDLALIFNYMKLLDPGSTVREGEFANAQNSGSVPTNVSAMYNKIMSGERLVPKQREDFVGRSSKLYKQAEGQHKKRSDTYVGLAESAGLDPRQVVVDLGAVVQEKPDAGSASGIIDFNSLPE